MGSLGLPIRCWNCPPKHYFGVLKGETVPTPMVRIGKNPKPLQWPRGDGCPNCGEGMRARDVR